MASNNSPRGKHRRPRRSAAHSRGTLASVAVFAAAGSLSGAASGHTSFPSRSTTDMGLMQTEDYHHTLVRTFSTQVVTEQKQADAFAQAEAEAEARAKAAQAAREKAAAEAHAKAAQAAQAKAAAETRAQATATATTDTTAYSNDLDGWIRHALAIMNQHGIPGTYDGIYRNIMRESSGNPHAVNLTDSNAAAGHPSEGLLQVIQPTFIAYHVSGTSWSITDPVANIVAACNYAYHQYGSIDHVNSAY
ncbi:MAG: transglycosylase SLT domain-containing protein [Streptomycetaceae bacterium]|nr:transglycosylase SLT domain-containing protein [Streptomycetaceae bacterium]